jgi:hypothetical protein
MGAIVTGKLLKWGNSYGIRISKGDVERQGLMVGQEFDVVPHAPQKVDLSHIRTFKGPAKFPGWSHDDVLYLDQLERMAARKSITKSEFAREKRALESKYARR